MKTSWNSVQQTERERERELVIIIKLHFNEFMFLGKLTMAVYSVYKLCMALEGLSCRLLLEQELFFSFYENFNKITLLNLELFNWNSSNS